ncbi:MAG: mechanosensitive ion channel [Butyrivibrio sp.]|uniref:mechanosensitive ion channel family protein n=1 Tax=Butyrivibrio sp. TaxID=28121 RepID=UPI0025DA31EC|nr:mechanosensitive ion channel domain-containing protein [Butyrivibrio sp.]MCR5770172.1 mechanosensitive ion channel [Butyrivibrio sp.]
MLISNLFNNLIGTALYQGAVPSVIKNTVLASTASSAASLEAVSSEEEMVSQTTEQAAETLAMISGTDVDPNAIEKFWNELPDKLLSLGIKLAFALIALIICWKIINVVVKAVRKSMERAKSDESIIHFVCKFFEVGLKFLVIVMIATSLGFDSASVVALLGSAGVAIGLAVQGTLSNLAGGVMILLVKPFRLGDYIIEDTHKHEGTVKEISLFTTKLITPDNRVIIIPNGELSNTSLTNATGNKVRLLQVYVGISYNESIDKARSVLEEAMNSSKYILKDREMMVVVNDFKDSSVELQLRSWVKSYDYLASKWDLNERAKKALDQAGIEIPFNQVDVHMKKD